MLQISAGALTPACDRNPMSVVRDTVVDMPPRESPSPRWCAVGRSGTAPGGLAAVELDESGGRSPEIPIPAGGLANFVAAREAEAPRRWVWADTPAVYPALLTAGVRVERCHDLRLCHQILRNSVLVRDRAALRAATQWAVVPDPVEEPRAPLMPALFELEAGSARRPTVPDSLSEALAEFDRQRAAIDSAAEPNRIALLLAAESVGALIAVELTSAGVPWDTEEHDRILSEALGSRPAPGAKPAALLAVGEEVRAALGDPAASLDSPPKLLRALRAAGIEASSTSRWELAEHEHPAIPPLLHYKKLARLLSANGWNWLDEWVRDGRYRPVYVPGGVVTGRWASSGGGALQIPRSLRPRCAPTPAAYSSRPMYRSSNRAFSRRCRATAPWPRRAPDATSTRESSRAGPWPPGRTRRSPCSVRCTAARAATAAAWSPGCAARSPRRCGWSMTRQRSASRAAS